MTGDNMTEVRTVADAIDKFTFIRGTGKPDEGTACVMTALSWVAGEAWSDHPNCAHPLLANLAIKANDAVGTTAEQRAEIVKAGEHGLLDTWWVPTVVVVDAIAKAAKDVSPADHALAVVDEIAAWKRGSHEKPYLRGADLWDANLRDADLEGADLRGANLRDADLEDANLRGANLRGADLRDANLRGAYLRDANLRDAYLRGANLRDADLEGADLRGANLRGADLEDANLRGADLEGAYLGGADLGGANLEGANLRGAYLRGANLRGADLGGAYGNGLTRLPAGWKVDDAGLIVRGGLQ